MAMCEKINHNLFTPEELLPDESECLDCMLVDSRREIERLQEKCRKLHAENYRFKLDGLPVIDAADKYVSAVELELRHQEISIRYAKLFEALAQYDKDKAQ